MLESRKRAVEELEEVKRKNQKLSEVAQEEKTQQEILRNNVIALQTELVAVKEYIEGLHTQLVRDQHISTGVRIVAVVAACLTSLW